MNELSRQHLARRSRLYLGASIAAAMAWLSALDCTPPPAPRVGTGPGVVSRERVSINGGWRFHEYSSTEQADDLIYDVRPEVRWAEDEVHTTGEPTKLSASVDRAEIRADGTDLSFVTVRVVDAVGLTAPRAQNAIRFRIEGPGQIVATDNGDPYDFTPFPAHERNAFHGLCLVIVRGMLGAPGAIELEAESDALASVLP